MLLAYVIPAIALGYFGKRYMLHKKVKDLLTTLEGERLIAYKDEAGKWTIGIGHLILPHEMWMTTRPITKSESEKLFSEDSKFAFEAVVDLVNVPLNDNQKAALVSLVFNIGRGAFAGSTLLRKLNAGNYSGAAEEFGRWVYAGGKKSNILIARRKKESNIFKGVENA